jgi:hypothetical protein
VSILSVIPEQENIKTETRRIRQEIDQANRNSKAEEPRIAVAYFIVNSNSMSETDKDMKLDPTAGPDLGNLPRLRMPDFSTNPPTFQQWTSLAKAGACHCRYLHDWLSKHAKDKNLGPSIPKTLYLTLQRIGRAQADDIVLTVDRVKLEATTNIPPFADDQLSNGSYGPVKKVDLELGSLEPGYGLRVPVAARVDFEAEDLDSLGGEIGVPEGNEFYYGVMYIPRKLSFIDPLKDERVQIPIREPIAGIIELSGGTGSGG